MPFGYCPTCKHQLRVVNTRHTDMHTIRRKRCSSCGHRAVTYEVTSGLYAHYLAIEKELAELKHTDASATLPEATEEQEQAYYESALNEEGEFLLARMKKGFGYKESVKPEDVTTEAIDAMMRKLLPSGGNTE